MSELTDDQRRAYDELAAAIDRVARSGLTESRLLDDDELLGDYVVVVHVMSANLLDEGESRYMTIMPNGRLPAHVASGLLKIGCEISESGWRLSDDE